MLTRWLKAWSQGREARALQRHAIPDELWQLTLLRYPFLALRSAADLAELRRLSSLFLASKEFHGVGSFEVTDEVAVAVAAQACLPVLRLGLGWYDGFVGIVMHADEVVAQREFTDDDGVVHQYEEALAGAQGGVMPPILRGRSRVNQVPGLEQAIFSIKVGEQIGPRQFAGAWWILRCLDKKPAVTQPFEKVKEDAERGARLKKGLPQQGQQLQEEYLAFQKKASVQAFWKRYAESLKQMQQVPAAEPAKEQKN